MKGHEAEEAGVNESVFTLLNSVAGVRIGSLIGAEDLSDKVNYKWTSSLLLMSAFIIVVRDFTFKPIECYTPPEWPHAWEEYVENYCWVQNNYHVSYLNASFPAVTERSSLELNYYQWVPFVLLLECLLVYMPHLVWRFLSLRSGINPEGLVRLAKRTITLDEKRKAKLIVHLTSEIEDAMGLHEAVLARHRTLRECLFGVLPCFWFGRRSGFALFFLYVISKLVYLLTGLGHLYVMRSFLGFQELSFGWFCAADLLQGRQWQQTRVFPRVTFCDVPIKNIGQWNIRSVQCVLPLNVLNEKLYIFLWFWTIFCMILTCVSTVAWLVKVLAPKIRQQFADKYLERLNLLVQKAKDSSEYKLRKDFVSVFLSLDGLFLLSLIEHNAGDICVTEVIFSLYGRYRDKKIDNGGHRKGPGGSIVELNSSDELHSLQHLQPADSVLSRRKTTAQPEEEHINV